MESVRILTLGATPQDLTLMRAVNQLFAEVFAEWDPQEREIYSQNPPSDSYLTKLLENPDFFVVVVVDENSTPDYKPTKVIGALTAYVFHKYEQERSEIYIYDLAVYRRYRRRGIATALIKHLYKEAARLGVYVIFVQADQGDEPAIKLYESLGTKEEVLHFDLNKIKQP